MIVFALGGFTCIISILRLQSLLVFLQTTDFSYHNPLAAIWSSLEVNIGITCSCLPTLKAMVARWFPRAFGSSYHLRGSDQRRSLGRACKQRAFVVAQSQDRVCKVARWSR